MANIDQSDSRYASPLGDRVVFILMFVGLYAGYALPVTLIAVRLLHRPDLEFMSVLGTFAFALAFATTRFRRFARPSRALRIASGAGYGLYLVLFLTGAFRALH